METLKNILTLNFAAGYRTYILVALFLLMTGLEKLGGVDVPGFDPGTDWLVQVMAALGFATVRAGMDES